MKVKIAKGVAITADPEEAERIEMSLRQHKEEAKAAELSPKEQRVLDYARGRIGQIQYSQVADSLTMRINDVRDAAKGLEIKGFATAGETVYTFRKKGERLVYRPPARPKPAPAVSANYDEPEAPETVYKGDLQENECNALHAINNATTTSIASLMNDLHIEKTSAADILESLAAKGLVNQNRMAYELTPTGADYLSRKDAESRR